MPPRGVIEVVAVRGLSTVQDGGRPGWMHDGVPPGGALVPELAARANLAVGNPGDAPLIEVFGGLTLTVRGLVGPLSTEDGSARSVSPGEPLEIPPSRALGVRYVAVAGGLDIPLALGGRGTLRVANLGGHEGRALSRGDRISVGHATTLARPAPDLTTLDLSAAVRVVAGPDLTCFAPDALEALVRASFTVLASSDRAGTRLSGPELRRVGEDIGRSTPMVKGAIQVPASDQPIVLGPDHPTTGGYPVIAVVARADLGRFFARPIGAAVRFTRVALDEARALVLA
jgi:5-oxoprolinase (ATP-hydrolysing) subunit C